MKTKIFFVSLMTALAVCAAALTSQAFMKEEKYQQKDEQGHVLKPLWKEYLAALKADRPKKKEECLDAIIDEAKAKRFHWDFYDAASRKVSDGISVNWKRRAELEGWLSEQVTAYDEPIVTYLYRKDRREGDLTDYVLVNRARLEAGKNQEFYSATNIELNGLLNGFIKDDYEYALWSEYISHGSGSKAESALEDYLGDRYPAAAWLEFHQADGRRWNVDLDKVKEFTEKYSSKAVSLFGKLLILQDEYSDLESTRASEDKFKALYAKVKAAEKERKSYTSGADGKIAASIDGFKSLIEDLESKDVSVSLKDDRIIVSFRNLDKVDLLMARDEKDPKPLLKKTVLNPKKSFHVFDTVVVSIPRCDDGNYLVKASNGKIHDVTGYSRNTLSISLREDSEGWKFYVADYLTGEPPAAVDLKLSLSGKEVAEASGVKVDGFTPLPGNIAKAMKKNSYYYLEASLKDAEGFLRKSHEQSLSNQENYYPGGSSETRCEIFTDKGAYNPGEILKFKAVLYEGDPAVSYHTLKAGNSVKAVLTDPEDNEAGTLSLTTNEFGSVSGEFELPEGARNGRFTLKIVRSTTIASKGVIVDEFILPTYDLAFENVDSLYFIGDEVEVKGTLKSYSGHPLDAARLTYTVDGWGTRAASGDIVPGPDGTFSLRFPTKDKGDWYGQSWYKVTVKVTDATGETKEFNRSVFVVDRFNVGISLENASAGDFIFPPGTNPYGRALLSGDNARVSFTVHNSDGEDIRVPLSYELKDVDGKVLETGNAMSGDMKDIAIPRPGLYTVRANSVITTKGGKEISDVSEMTVLRVDDDAEVLDARVENFFKPVGSCADGSLKDGEAIHVSMGAGAGPVWAVAELFGDKRQPLARKLIHLDGVAGKAGSIGDISFDFKKEYPDAVYFTVFYFRNGRHYVYSREFRREKEEIVLPLEFSSFEDKALPGREYSITIKSAPGVEALAAVFDKSSETIAPNRWGTVRLVDRGAMGIWFRTQVGSITDYYEGDGVLYETAVRNGRRVFKTGAAVSRSEMVVEDALDLPVDEMVPILAVAEAPAPEEEAAIEEVQARSDFSTSLAFEPFLRTGKDGEATLKFKTSDKLSTFIVQVYAHNPEMLNSVIRKEMVVSIPVKVNLVEPKYLYKGDKPVIHVSVSNASDVPVSGTVALQAFPSADYQGRKPFSTSSKKVTVPAGGSVPLEFSLDPKGNSEIGLRVVFADSGKSFSDGVFVTLPVYDAEQTITEAHSAVLLAGMDKDALIKRLRSEFTGTTSAGAELKEIDIRRMLLDAIPSKVEPSGNDVLSLSEAFYVRKVAAKLGSEIKAETPDAELLSKILSCRNADGGFGWFEGMRSSAVITAVLLERFAKMEAAGMPVEGFDPASSVKFLDRNQFLHDTSWPYWCGWLSDAQYAYVRSMYASVPFDVSRETASERSEYSKNYKAFKKYMKDYLIPSEKDGRGLQGQILAKARRIKTLVNLVNGEGGTALASAWGIKFSAESKMSKSIIADVLSLTEYAVEHRDGGWYYPNAVMPWRGLLESELYAHSLLCDLLSDGRLDRSADPATLKTISDGIRIWMMLQKETQQWADDPAYVDAINSVLMGGEDVLSTRVVLLTKTYRKPFKEIVSAGNGFTIERRFFKEVLGADSKIGRIEIYPGMKLSVGDKVVAEYRIWNQENRSFVKLIAPREAAFRPVKQLSGHIGWWLRPVGGAYSITPQGYRNVKTDRTEYFFDVYPEENTTVTEEFYITQEGVFTAPVVTIESLYAPHYRANDKFGGALSVIE